MGAPQFSSSTTITRLRREDCKQTKHDSEFSVWKILIGHSDWENFKLGKEGTERYRIHNLPSQYPCSGLYELGIVVSQSNLGRGDVRKLDSKDIIVVYLGQADNVKKRLQEYGRAGSHLDNGTSLGQFDAIEGSFSQKGPGLFKEMFSRGFSIAFRWAAMENKKEAEKTEAQLLRVFDYAWNKGSNGTRRSNDILLKLDKITSTTIQLPYIAKKLQWLLDKVQKQSGISIKASSPPSTDTQSHTCNDKESDYPRAWIFKFGRTQPRLVSDKCGTNAEPDIICRVALEDGSFCKQRPVEGRKRCGEHKGKRINGFITRSVVKKSTVCGFDLEDGSVCSKVALHGRKRCELHEEWTVLKHPPLVISDTKPLIEDHASICGVMLGDGSVCKSKPIEGRKRCGEHKGQRCELHEEWTVLKHPPLVISDTKPLIEDHASICGVMLGDGSVCKSKPTQGRKRCGEHKGQRVQGSIPPLIISDTKPPIEDHDSICGVMLGDGSVCNSKPIEGRKRCGEHKGQRVQGSILKSATKEKPQVCGLGLGDGSVCTKIPVRGRKRCELHKGRRIITVSYKN